MRRIGDVLEPLLAEIPLCTYVACENTLSAAP
jgi:hypothetical protein